MVADLLTNPLARETFEKLKFKLLYGFGGDAENIGTNFTGTSVQRDWTTMMIDAVLVAQIRTRINSVKDYTTKNARLTDDENQNEQKHIDL